MLMSVVQIHLSPPRHLKPASASSLGGFFIFSCLSANRPALFVKVAPCGDQVWPAVPRKTLRHLLGQLHRSKRSGWPGEHFRRCLHGCQMSNQSPKSPRLLARLYGVRASSIGEFRVWWPPARGLGFCLQSGVGMFFSRSPLNRWNTHHLRRVQGGVIMRPGASCTVTAMPPSALRHKLNQPDTLLEYP